MCVSFYLENTAMLMHSTSRTVGQITQIYRLKRSLKLSVRRNLQSAKLSHAFKKPGTISASCSEVVATLPQLLGEVLRKPDRRDSMRGSPESGVWLCPLNITPARVCMIHILRTLVLPSLDLKQNSYNE